MNDRYTRVGSGTFVDYYTQIYLEPTTQEVGREEQDNEETKNEKQDSEESTDKSNQTLP